MNTPAGTWLAEVLDILEQRRRTVLATAIGVSLVGIVVTYLAPTLLPSNPVVGAAVGLAAVLLAIAAALGVDSVDLTIRGARHVRAAGGDVVAELAGRPLPDQTTALADALEPLGDEPLRVAFAPVSRSITTVPRWTDALAVELSRRDHRVVVLDLASGPDETGHPGVLEVVRDGVRLADAVRFDPELLLARLGPGADDDAALAAWPRLADKLPSDVDILLLSLPSVTRPGVLGALASADRTWLVAATDRTARVDLIAGLDAADRTGTPTEVVLLDPSREHPAPTSVAGTASADDDWHPEPLGLDEPTEDATSEPEIVEEAEPEAIEEPGPFDEWDEDTPFDEWDDDPVEPPVEDDDPVEPSVEDAEPVATDEEPTASEPEDDDQLPSLDDPTDEFPTLVIPEARPAAEVAEDAPDDRPDDDRDDRPDDGPWGPSPDEGSSAFTPFAGPDQSEDPVRVAAALQTLAQEVWARDEDRP